MLDLNLAISLYEELIALRYHETRNLAQVLT
jgi:hypothetical protein